MTADDELMLGLLKEVNTDGGIERLVANLQTRWEADRSGVTTPDLDPLSIETLRELDAVGPVLGITPRAQLVPFLQRLLDLGDRGWTPFLFDAVLRGSPHWEAIRNTPEEYGVVVTDWPARRSSMLPMVIDANTPKVVELAPNTLADLVTGLPFQMRSVLTPGRGSIWVYRAPVRRWSAMRPLPGKGPDREGWLSYVQGEGERRRARHES